jgi:hypothetical protein
MLDRLAGDDVRTGSADAKADAGVGSSPIEGLGDWTLRFCIYEGAALWKQASQTLAATA